LTKSSSPTSPDSTNRLVVDLPCGKKSLLRARQKVMKFAGEHGYAEDAEDIVLATQEALKNVIQHACPADNNMHLVCIADHDHMVIEVSDIGQGFDVGDVLNTPVSPMQSHGRGFQLIKGLMDDVWVTSEQEGTMVHMEKKRRSSSL
jgi:anti-sigma regulatory factor (Ser/Thr protein kinase)